MEAPAESAETAKLFQYEGATVVVTGSSERSVGASRAALPGIEVLVSDAGNVAATKFGRPRQDQTRPHRRSVRQRRHRQVRADSQIDEAFYDGQFNVNVKGAFFLLKHAIPIIPDGGAIILTASVAGAAGGLGGSTIYGPPRRRCARSAVLSRN